MSHYKSLMKKTRPLTPFMSFRLWQGCGSGKPGQQLHIRGWDSYLSNNYVGSGTKIPYPWFICSRSEHVNIAHFPFSNILDHFSTILHLVNASWCKLAILPCMHCIASSQVLCFCLSNFITIPTSLSHLVRLLASYNHPSQLTILTTSLSHSPSSCFQ